MARSSTTFKPGEVHNPGGMTKEMAVIRERAKKALWKMVPTAITHLEDEIHAGTKNALPAAVQVLNRTLGVPTETVELNGPGGEPFVLRVEIQPLPEKK